MGRRPATALPRLVLVSCLALSVLLGGCNGASQAATTPEAVATPTPSITATPGTLEWYVASAPTFPLPPRPAKITVPKGDQALVWKRVPTDQKVAFITIDDGQYQDPLWADFIEQANIPVTSFLTYYFVWKVPEYFKRIHPSGRGIHNHGKSHTDFVKFPLAEQKAAICSAAQSLQDLFDRRPTLLRPPYGSFNDATLKAASQCGFPLVVTWTHFIEAGMFRSGGDKPLEPGAIILLHYRPTLPKDLLVALQAIRQAGLVPAYLDDYVEFSNA
jgi:peptidoglycan/xylan/chitin deacetylase (PgdA/CDA1 family)